LIRLKLRPTDVADMNIRNHELPFRPRNLGRAVLAVRQQACADATIDERTGIARVMQYLEVFDELRTLGLRHLRPVQIPVAHFVRERLQRVQGRPFVNGNQDRAIHCAEIVADKCYPGLINVRLTE